MTDLSVFYSSLAAVALIIALGFGLGKAKWIDEHANKILINILLMVAMPCALFAAFPAEFHADSWRMFLYGLGGGVVAFAIVIIISKLVFNHSFVKKNYREHQFAFIFNNASFLGFPLVQTIFGAPGLVPYAGFIVVFNIALFSYGRMLFENKFSWAGLARAFINPNVIAVALGTLAFLFSLHLPPFLNQAVTYVGGITTPLSLMCIGFMLSRAHLKSVWKRRQMFVTCLLQLTLGPVVTYVALKLVGAPTLAIQVLVLIQALPTATSLGLFAEKYGGDTNEASALVVISTMMSVVTLPVVIFLIFRFVS